MFQFPAIHVFHDRNHTINAQECLYYYVLINNSAALAKLWGLKDYTREVIVEVWRLCKA
jgi:hypothetical protein